MNVAKDPTNPRQRLLDEASRLFSERGFDAVTTREICAAANLNPGAIHYHFGDKDGLYREVLRQPIHELKAQLAGFDDPTLTLHQALMRFLAPFLIPDMCEQRLFLREMQEPSAMLLEAIKVDLKPFFDGFVELLARHIGVNPPDATIYQLAYGLQAMAHDYSLTRPFMDAMTPTLLADDPDCSKLCSRLADWGCALVAYEKARRL
jgi:TetR/AcrR family transcriptional regulator, regulator of cefoperazone and chloramphenicol sensitivity